MGCMCLKVLAEQLEKGGGNRGVKVRGHVGGVLEGAGCCGGAVCACQGVG